ncbi:tetratricopeptide repeat protein [bacterium BMS3Abin07]|nr:tetratricopeptide repeat protein [bacterium BMS3Abin07]GBE32602.1 tetratricopeptide repeat protein [bacterium BMS3Bbin05]HDO22498.1 DUF3808 domain-containing protein [Nitrospirota bacterium]HDZ88830.1 DUF3808 domain-containing protein [Nitrospirota bacterium]
MPKPIKKRIVKKTRTEEEVKNIYEHLKSIYVDNAKNVQIIILVLIVLVFSAIGLWFYLNKASARTAELQYKAYKAYEAARSGNDRDLLKEALIKLKNVNKHKESSLYLYYEADVLQTLGNTDDAIKVLNSLVDKFSSDIYILPLSYSKLGMLYIGKGNYEKALKVFRALEDSSLPVYRDFAIYEEAWIFKKLGKDEEAMKYKVKLVTLFPGSPYAREVQAELKALQEREAKKQKATNSSGKKPRK